MTCIDAIWVEITTHSFKNKYNFFLKYCNQQNDEFLQLLTTLLDYYTLAHYYFSKSTTLCDNISLTFFTSCTTASSLEKLLFSLRISCNKPSLSSSTFLYNVRMIEIKYFLKSLFIASSV